MRVCALHAHTHTCSVAMLVQTVMLTATILIMLFNVSYLCHCFGVLSSYYARETLQCLRSSLTSYILAPGKFIPYCPC